MRRASMYVAAALIVGLGIAIVGNITAEAG